MTFKDVMRNQGGAEPKGACWCAGLCAAIACKCKCSGGIFNTSHNNQVTGSGNSLIWEMLEPGP